MLNSNFETPQQRKMSTENCWKSNYGYLFSITLYRNFISINWILTFTIFGLFCSIDFSASNSIHFQPDSTFYCCDRRLFIIPKILNHVLYWIRSEKGAILSVDILFHFMWRIVLHLSDAATHFLASGKMTLL